MANPMDVYEQIKKIGPEAKTDADTFMQGLAQKHTKEHPAPPEEITTGLEGILAKHKPHTSSNKYLALAAAVLIAVALAMPYSAPATAAGYASAATYTAPLYVP